MINVRGSLRSNRKDAEINISPLIDLVFLLLIFFMVTTSFVKETGVDVERPSAATATVSEKGNIMIAVTKDGGVFFDRKPIDIRSIRALVTRSLVENPGAQVIIVADKISHTGKVINVMDECKLAGAEKISIAASKSSGQ
ncbi:MAG: biopolymer transporter ExbD [Deltaproteobacteria bacterium]|nr:MAG: biopolymer transporter ExbD [Deltaproteobacteria bacterium]